MIADVLAPESPKTREVATWCDEVDVELVDGQSIHGKVHSWQELSTATALELNVGGHPLTLPWAAARMAQRRDTTGAAGATGGEGAFALPRDVPRSFQIVFADAKTMQGICGGFENRK